MNQPTVHPSIHSSTEIGTTKLPEHSLNGHWHCQNTTYISIRPFINGDWLCQTPAAPPQQPSALPNYHSTAKISPIHPSNHKLGINLVSTWCLTDALVSTLYQLGINLVSIHPSIQPPIRLSIYSSINRDWHFHTAMTPPQ